MQSAKAVASNNTDVEMPTRRRWRKGVLNGDVVNGSTQSRLLVARNKTRQRWQPAMRLSDVLLGYLGDAADDPSPIKLIEAGGKTN